MHLHSGIKLSLECLPLAAESRREEFLQKQQKSKFSSTGMNNSLVSTQWMVMVVSKAQADEEKRAALLWTFFPKW